MHITEGEHFRIKFGPINSTTMNNAETKKRIDLSKVAYLVLMAVVLILAI